MSKLLELATAYQRLAAKRVAVDAIEGKRTQWNRRFMQKVLEDSHYVNWIEDRPGWAWVHEPNNRHGGLVRSLGRCVPDGKQARHGGILTDDITGWYTNEEGYSDSSGDGLVWGEVFALTHGRVVAGYRFGACKEEATINFSSVWYSFAENSSLAAFSDDDEIRECAHHADRMARDAAEEEREYERSQREEDDDEAA